MKILIAILIFSFIIIFHEYGHFLAARACGVRVNEFWLGMGPTIFHFTKGETTYCLKALPFGGACVMEGEEGDSEDERAFCSKPLWKRALIVAAGPLFNVLLGLILSIVMLGAMGVMKPVVDTLTDGYPAQEAGIEPGDTITALNHYHIYFYNEISVYTYLHAGEALDVTYLRNGEEKTATIEPQYDASTGRYYLGITAVPKMTKLSALQTIGYSFCELRYQFYVALEGIKMLFTGQVGLSDMSGPVGIVKVIGDTYDASVSSGILYVVMNLINITVLLTTNLAVANLLPIPALDGGRLLIFLIEAVSRRRVNEQIEARINMIGFCFLMGLMVVVMISDISKLFV